MISCPGYLYAGKGPRLPAFWTPGTGQQRGQDRKPWGGGGDGASPAQGQGVPHPHPHQEGGTTVPSLRMHGSDLWQGREAALGPLSAILGMSLSASSKAAPRTPARHLGKRVWAVPLFPELWGSLAWLAEDREELRLQWPGSVHIYWGGSGEAPSGLGGTLAHLTILWTHLGQGYDVRPRGPCCLLALGLWALGAVGPRACPAGLPSGAWLGPESLRNHLALCCSWGYRLLTGCLKPQSKCGTFSRGHPFFY